MEQGDKYQSWVNSVWDVKTEGLVFSGGFCSFVA